MAGWLAWIKQLRFDRERPSTDRHGARKRAGYFRFCCSSRTGSDRTGSLDATYARRVEVAGHIDPIHLVVSDNSAFDVSADQPITVIRSSLAASVFRERCLVLEASPHDVLIAFGPYLPTIDTVAQLRVAARNEELISAVAPRITLGPNSEVMALVSPLASSASGRIDPRYAPRLSPAYYLPEILCPCMLVSGRMIGNIDVPDGFDHFPDLILAFLRAGRRAACLSGSTTV